MAEDDAQERAPEHHAPTASGTKGKLKQRVGPLPLWGWGVVGVAGLAAIVYLMRKKKAAATGASSDYLSAGDAGSAASGAGGGIGGGNGGLGSGTFPPGSVIVPGTGGGGTTPPTTDCVPSGLPAFMQWPCTNKVPDWLQSHGQTGPISHPPGYHLRTDLLNKSFDPSEPDVWVPDGTPAPAGAGVQNDFTVTPPHDTGTGQASMARSSRIFVPPATVNGQPSTVEQRRQAQEDFFRDDN